MIGFEQLIHAIHSAISSANDSLMQENLKLLDTYFEEADESEHIRSALDDALGMVNDVLSSGRPDKETMSRLMEAFEEARDSLQDKGKPKGISREVKSLQAKTVVIQYPDQTASGLVMRSVHVPLITLVPVSTTKITEIKFRSTLEVQVQQESNQLMVSFPQKPADGNIFNHADHPAGTLIEITIAPQGCPDGLKKLIEGYEKILRSQIPN